MEGARRKVFARDLIFGGSYVSKAPHLKGGPITRVLQAARRINRATSGGQ